MSKIKEFQIDQDGGLDSKYMSFSDSDIEYNYFKNPPDLEKAQLHRQAYTVHKEKLSNSQQCLCCHFHKDHIKYNFFEGRKYYHHHNSIGEYFELIKYCIYQLLIIGIFLVPYCSIIHSYGNQCQKIPNCDPNTNKIYSVWNLIPKYKYLDDQNYSYFVHFTFLLLQIVHFRFFYNRKTTKRIQTPAMFEYLKSTCLYFPKSIHQDIVQYMKSKQQNLFEYIVFDLKKYEDSLFEELKFQYSKKYEKDDKWEKKILMKLLLDNSLLKECITGKIVLMDKVFLFKREVYLICIRYNQQVEQYQYQDTEKKYIKALWFIFFNLLFSYYLPRILITLTMFFRLKLITIYFQDDDLKIIQGIIKALFGITQILILKLSDYVCRNGSSMVHQAVKKNFYHQFQLFVFVDLALSGHFTQWTDCFNPFNYYTELDASRWMLQKEGLVDNQITISYLNIFIPVLTSIFDLKYLWKLIKFTKEKRKNFSNLTQIEANKLFEKREFQINQRRFTIYKIYCLCLSTALFYPFMILSSIISLLLIYVVDKYLFIKHSIPIRVGKLQEQLQCFIFFGLNLYHSNLIIQYKMISISNMTNNILFILGLFLQFYVYFESVKIYYSNSFVKSTPKQYEMIKFLKQFNVVEFRNGRFCLHNDEIYKIFLNLKKKIKKFDKEKKRSIIVEDHFQLE